MSKEKVVLFWFRRDLRLDDNPGLNAALETGQKVLPLFIFDPDILKMFPDAKDKRLSFIYGHLKSIKQSIQEMGGQLKVFHQPVDEVFKTLLQEFEVLGLYANEDFEPKNISRDKQVAELLTNKSIPFSLKPDHYLVRPGEVLKADGNPYTVYSPFYKQWAKANKEEPRPLAQGNWWSGEADWLPLEAMGYEYHENFFFKPGWKALEMSNYAEQRDFPAQHGCSQMAVHLRFGTVSVRQLYKHTRHQSETYVKELAWREFFAHILFHFPEVEQQCFKPQYEQVPWLNEVEKFQLWCEGKTGYPMVDAGMRELNETGHMHNRVRMVVASFLCKHLLIDWRWGEAYFAQKLLDYDLASNNGNWQWAAGCGCDAAPYFRVFNPSSQQEKFDPKDEYIRTWVKEYGTADYADPIVEHKFARERALNTYKNALVP